MTSPLTLCEVNNLNDEHFEELFGNVIELCKEASSEVKNKRPFKTVTDLCKAFNTYLDDLDKNGKLRVLQLHPDLAGRMAARGELTKESTSEQKSAGLHELTDEQSNTIQECNIRYKAKFGFPFIICARENKVQSIIQGLQSRNRNTREQEILNGIEEVKKICKLRILDIVKS